MVAVAHCSIVQYALRAGRVELMPEGAISYSSKRVFAWSDQPRWSLVVG